MYLIVMVPVAISHSFFSSVELNPYAAHVYFNRANLYASLRKYKESEDDYTRGKLPAKSLLLNVLFHLIILRNRAQYHVIPSRRGHVSSGLESCYGSHETRC